MADVGIKKPVVDKGAGQAFDHRSLKTHHEIDPSSDSGFLLEHLGVHHVLAAGIGDSPVDNDQFAVIADIDPGKKGGEDPGRQRLLDLDTRPSHLLDCLGSCVL